MVSICWGVIPPSAVKAEMLYKTITSICPVGNNNGESQRVIAGETMETPRDDNPEEAVYLVAVYVGAVGHDTVKRVGSRRVRL